MATRNETTSQPPSNDCIKDGEMCVSLATPIDEVIENRLIKRGGFHCIDIRNVGVPCGGYCKFVDYGGKSDKIISP